VLLFFAGDIVPIANPATPPITPPDLPPFDNSAASKYIQVLLSSYTFETGLYTFYEAGLLFWSFYPNEVPFGLNNTDGYTLIAPNLPKLYPDDPVTVTLTISTMPVFNITTQAISLQAMIDFTFNVTTGNSEVLAFIIAANTR
jgi:hypothetical protein